MKQVYLFDEDNVFAGVYIAQESPLEEGVYIAPVNSTEIEPPIFTSLQTCHFVDGSWVIEDKPVVPPESLPGIPPQPRRVSAVQAKIALDGAGYYSSIVAYMSLPSTPLVEVIAWDSATEFTEDSPTLLALADKVNIPRSQIPLLFDAAEQVVI